MEQAAATSHAQDTARAAVREGLTDRDTARQLYFRYREELQQNRVGGSFTHYLLAQGVIDQRGFEHLWATVPAPISDRRRRPSAPPPAPEPAARAGWGDEASGSFKGVRPEELDSEGDFESQGGATPLVLGTDTDSHDLDRTLNYEGVLEPPAPARDPHGSSLESGRLPTRADTQRPPTSRLPSQPDLRRPSTERLPSPRDPFVSKRVPREQAQRDPFVSKRVPREESAQPDPFESGPALTPLRAGGSSVEGPFDETLDPGDEAPLGLASAPLGPAPLGSRGVGDLSQSDAVLELISDPRDAREADFFAPPTGDPAPVAEPLTSPDEDGPQPGEVLGEYQLIEVLGRGGMGVIYTATHTETGERFALKTLKVGRGKSANKRRLRFQREFEALKRLEHDNVVKVYTCGRHGDTDWYTMDLIEGRELKAAIKADDLKPREKLEIFEQICQAVECAHEKNVIHRDLKPGNVLIDAQNKAYVLDFGLAKIADDEELTLTKTGAALGTPYYMAPEQVLSPKDVDYRVDIFSLGVILYELMAGIRPFRGQTAGEVSNKILNEEPIKPTQHNDKLYPSMDLICLKALEKEPEERYQSAAELRRAVAKYRRGAGVGEGGGLAGFKAAFKRYLGKHKEPVALGVALASLVYLPIILLLLLLS